MAPVRLGLVLSQERQLALARPADGIEVVVLASTLCELPRERALRQIAERVRERLPDAELVPYVWHPVSHASDDPLPGRGKRVVAGRAAGFGHLQESPEVRAAWELFRAGMRAIGASRAILRTPAAFTPGRVAHTRLVEFARARREDSVELVWEPEGLWEEPNRASTAAAAGLALMAPATLERPAVTSLDWFGVGLAGGLTLDRASSTVDFAQVLVDRDRPATVVFGGPAGVRGVRRLAGALQQCAAL